MKIHRSHPAERFTVLPDGTLRDPRLSYAARGVLAEILSRPDDWDTSADDLWRRARQERAAAGEGRDKIRAAFAELEAAGYMRRARRRISAGRVTTEIHVYDISAGRTDDGTSRPRSEGAAPSYPQPESSPQVTPTTDHQASVDQASVDQASVYQASLRRPTTETYTETDHSKDLPVVAAANGSVEGSAVHRREPPGPLAPESERAEWQVAESRRQRQAARNCPVCLCDPDTPGGAVSLARCRQAACPLVAAS